MIEDFCSQQISEGMRVDYKRDFPKNDELARTICAFSNTYGGIILIGVQADKVKNVPVDIPGIQITKGLEERVVNICLSHILPVVMPETKVCTFKSNGGSERAVLLVRVGLSYDSPHYLLQSNEILVRVGCKNDRANLQLIEDMIERRGRIRNSLVSSSSTWWPNKMITVDVPVFETAVVVFNFAKERTVSFNSENDSLLNTMANEVMTLNEQTPYPNYLRLESRNRNRETTRFCRIDADGRMIFQKIANVDRKLFDVFESFVFLTKVLKTARKMCLHLTFYGEVSVGLTITNSAKDDLVLVSSSPKWPFGDYRCNDETIYVTRTLRYDDFDNLSEALESMFSEFCRYFHFAPSSSMMTEIVEKEFLRIWRN